MVCVDAGLLGSLMTDRLSETLFSGMRGCVRVWHGGFWHRKHEGFLTHTQTYHIGSPSLVCVSKKLPWFKMAPVSLMSVPPLLWALCSLVTARLLADMKTQRAPEAQSEIRNVAVSVREHAWPPSRTGLRISRQIKNCGALKTLVTHSRRWFAACF